MYPAFQPGPRPRRQSRSPSCRHTPETHVRRLPPTRRPTRRHGLVVIVDVALVDDVALVVDGGGHGRRGRGGRGRGDRTGPGGRRWGDEGVGRTGLLERLPIVGRLI